MMRTFLSVSAFPERWLPAAAPRAVLLSRGLFVLSHGAGAASRGKNHTFVRYGGSTSNSVLIFSVRRGVLAA